MKRKEPKDRVIHRMFNFDPALSELFDKMVPNGKRSRFVREAVIEALHKIK